MDTVFSPYNSMFAIDFTRQFNASTYLLKVNGQQVKYTHQPYWKKDFLEESLSNYSKFKLNDNMLFMDIYLNARISNDKAKKALSKRLIPNPDDTNKWLAWYVQFAGYTIPSGATIELWQYDLTFFNNKAIVKDSSIIYKTLFINAQ